LSQEEIIQNLAHSVKAQLKEGPQESKELEVRLQDLRYKRERLAERLKQLRLLTRMNDGQLPRDYLGSIQDEELKEHSEEVGRLRRYEDELLALIQETAKQLDALGPAKPRGFGEERYYKSSQDFHGQEAVEWGREKEGLDFQLRHLQNKAFNLEREVQLRSQEHAKQMADLKF